MIKRRIRSLVVEALAETPVVAILGPRQVGKTTLALDIAAGLREPVHYLDLERESDLAKLAEAELYLAPLAGRLTVIDEVQRRPDLFPLLRSLVDARLRGGEPAGHFLILGSASRDLLNQSSESLAGRIAYLELSPFTIDEIDARDALALDELWMRGGFPGSLLAANERASWRWRTNFITTYLERDIPQLGPRLPAGRLRRLWSMLAHGQAGQLNLSRLAAGLGVTGKTVRHHIDVLTDLYMLRQLPPWSGNSAKRLVKSPKIYVRDSGLLHRLANVPDRETLLGHPLCGGSWEGLVIEQLLAGLPDHWTASYYCTSAQAEIDLVLQGPGGVVHAIEIKRSLSPRPGKGFLLGADDIGASRRNVVYPGSDRYPVGPEIEAIGLPDLLDSLRQPFAYRWGA